MSVRTPVRSLIASSLVLFAGCSDVVAPVTSAIQEVSAVIANLVGCTNTWANPVSGLWSDATKWSTGAVPAATDDVCITVDGNYRVTLTGTRTARNVTVGATVGTPELELQAQQPTTTGAQVPATLTVTDDVENTGVIRMNATGFIGRTATFVVTNGAVHNKAGGVFEVVRGVGGGRVIGANVVNDGAFTVQWPTTYNKLDARFSNSGAVTIGADGTLTMASTFNTTFEHNEGTLAVDGAFDQISGAFEFTGGVISGNPILIQSATLTLGASSTAATFQMERATTLMGDVHADQTLIVMGRSPTTTGARFPATMNAPESYSNAGLIRLTSSGFIAVGATLQTAAGKSITNEPTGRIEFATGAGGTRDFRTDIINNGSVIVGQPTAALDAANSVVNNATFFIGPTNSFKIGFVGSSVAATFNQAAGELRADGRLIVEHGAFHLGGGTVTGVPELTATDVIVPDGSTATGTLRLFGVSTLTGDLTPAQTLIVEGHRVSATAGAVSGILMPTEALTNHGLIQFTSSVAGATSPGSPSQLDVRSGTFTNAGRMEMLPGAGGARSLLGDITNVGTIHLAAPASHIAQTLRNVAPGTITGGLQFTVGSHAFLDGDIVANIHNTGVLHLGQSPGILNVTGNFSQVTPGVLNVEIGGSPSAPGTDFDRFNITGVANLSGAINVSAVNGECVDGGNSYQVMTFASRVGDFPGKTGFNLGGGRTVTAAPGATDYTLNVVGPPCVAPDVTPPVITPSVVGTLGNNGWYVSDVSVSWTVVDDESAISSSTGCGATSVTIDTNGETFTCSATSAGGSSSQSVTIKRDATAPVVSASRAPAANANGWNNVDVTATWHASDDMSGLAGAGTATQLFSSEAANQSGAKSFSDLAGNSASASVTGISIDKTAPEVTGEQPPLPASRWYNTDVTVTFTATDALSGVSGSAIVTHTFTQDGVAQVFGHTFVDRAGNTTPAGTEVNLDKTSPVVTVLRAPAPGPDGWNETDVTVTYAATDALSGIDGDASFTQVFSLGENQGGSHTFSDRAGNSATGTISGINIRTPPPPPPFAVACSATPSAIWPPNGKMVAVHVTITGTGIASYALSSVTNNQTGAADAEGWTIGTGDVDGSVRGARLGSGARVYALTYAVTSATGVATNCAVTVTVPHDQGKTK